MMHMYIVHIHYIPRRKRERVREDGDRERGRESINPKQKQTPAHMQFPLKGGIGDWPE